MHICIRRESIAICLAAAVLAAGSALSAAQAPSFLPTLFTIGGNGTSGYTGDGAAATAAELSNTISAGTMDPAGNFYIADTKNNVIRKITPAGIISTFAGNGTAGYAGDNGLATSAEFSAPSSVRYYQGGIYVTDFTNGRIRRIDLVTNMIKTVAGGGAGALNNANPSGVGTNITIPQPQDVAFDSLGNMYWSQGGGTSRVDVLNLASGMAYIFAGTGGTGGANGVSIGTATKTLTQPEETVMNGTVGLAVDAQNNVYVGETATHVIRKIIVGATPTISTYAGIGIPAGAKVCTNATNTVGDGCPASGANFGTVEHFSIDGAGNIYLADSTNGRIRVIPTSSDPTVGGVVYTLIGNGGTTDSPNGTYASAASLGAPFDAQILPNGDVLLINRTAALVRLVHQPGEFLPTAVGSSSSAQAFNVLTQASTGTFSLPGAKDFAASGAQACAAGVGITGTVCTYSVLFQPTIAGNRTTPLQFTDANGTIVAGLSGMGAAPVASLLPGLTATAAGTGTSGATGDAGAASAATFETPGAVAVDSFGNVYVADAAANEVRKFAPSGNITRVAGTGTAGSTGDGAAATAATLSGPSGVAVDAAGNIYIADTGNNKIRMVNAATAKISTVAGTGTAGYTGDQSTPAAATLNAPTQLAWSPLGILYVADTGNSVIRAIALNEQLITTVAGNGTPSFDGDGGLGQAAELNSPQGVAVDGSNNVYIADTANNRVRELSQGYINTLAGQTGSSFNGDGPAAGATLAAPTGVAADLAGNVYVADTANNRIRVISSGQITTVMGSNTASATGDGGSSAQATVSSPQAIALDPAGNIYVADTGNHKVRSIGVGGTILAFKTVNPTESSPVQTVMVFNSGNQNLSISSVIIPATGYTEQASSGGAVDCNPGPATPITLTPGTSCNLNTVFNPPVVNGYNGAITIADNNESVATATQTIQLQATSAIVYTPTLTIPSTATAGVAVTGSLSIANPVSVYTGTMTFTSTDPQAVLPPTHTFTLADNDAITLSAAFKTAGPQCLTATDTVDPTVTSTACTTVAASTAAKIVVYSGNNQSADVSTAYAQRLVALVTDAYGNSVGNQSVNFTISPNGAATGSFSSGALTYSTTADNTGYATALVITPGATVGTFTVTAALPGTSSTASFSLSIAVIGSFTIIPTFAQVGPVSPGASTSESLTIVGSGGFNAPITFSCTAPTGITCTAGPSPFSIATQGSVPATVNFTSEGSLLGNTSGFTSPWAALIALAAGGLLFLRRRKLSAVVVAVLAFVAVNALSGCGQYYAPITKNGTYVVTVTGTAQTVTATTSITYTVQK